MANLAACLKKVSGTLRRCGISCFLSSFKVPGTFFNGFLAPKQILHRAGIEFRESGGGGWGAEIFVVAGDHVLHRLMTVFCSTGDAASIS